ncbi:hypothetical protein VTO73DRAFT_5449 [Trametes versicolor]
MPRPRPRYVPTPRKAGESEKIGERDDSPPGSPIPNVATSARKMSTKVSRASMKPEVVIMVPRTGSHRGKTPAKQNEEAGPSNQTQSKGKKVASSAVTSEPPPAPSSSRRTPLQTRSVSEESCSPQPVPPKGQTIASRTFSSEAATSRLRTTFRVLFRHGTPNIITCTNRLRRRPSISASRSQPSPCQIRGTYTRVIPISFRVHTTRPATRSHACE